MSSSKDSDVKDDLKRGKKSKSDKKASSPEVDSKKSKLTNDKDEHEDVEKLVQEVHTANNWEKADLGDDKRKLKFLKLMGATKVSSLNDLL
jgi:hypothetical protein